MKCAPEDDAVCPLHLTKSFSNALVLVNLPRRNLPWQPVGFMNRCRK